MSFSTASLVSPTFGSTRATSVSLTASDVAAVSSGSAAVERKMARALNAETRYPDAQAEVMLPTALAAQHRD